MAARRYGACVRALARPARSAAAPKKTASGRARTGRPESSAPASATAWSHPPPAPSKSSANPGSHTADNWRTPDTGAQPSTRGSAPGRPCTSTRASPAPRRAYPQPHGGVTTGRNSLHTLGISLGMIPQKHAARAIPLPPFIPHAADSATCKLFSSFVSSASAPFRPPAV